MEFKLKTFNTPVTIERIANIHYFEFINEYHTIPDTHNFRELVYVDKGSITVKAENYEGPLCDNQIIIHRQNERHSITCDADTTPDVIVIGFECSCPELDIFSGMPTLVTPELKKLLARALNEGMSVFAPPYNTPYLKDMKKRSVYPYGADQLIKLYLEEFLILLIRTAKESNNLANSENVQTVSVDRIWQYVNEHYSEKISLDNLCFLFGTNKTTLCRDFKKVYGVTLLNYINTLKIKDAKRLLRGGNLSVTEVSEKCGFNSVHYFCRFFTKQTGLSPKKYIKTIYSMLDKQ